MQQTVMEGFAVDVQDGPQEQKVLIFTEVAPQTGQTFVIPLPKEVAADVGRKLQGHSVVTAPANALEKLKVVGQ